METQIKSPESGADIITQYADTQTQLNYTLLTKPLHGIRRMEKFNILEFF